MQNKEVSEPRKAVKCSFPTNWNSGQKAFPENLSYFKLQ